MKKFLFFAAVLMMAACGSKTGNNANGADSTVKDSVLTTETALSAEETETDIQKTIETQLQTVYAKLREMVAALWGCCAWETDSEGWCEECDHHDTEDGGCKLEKSLLKLGIEVG